MSTLYQTGPGDEGRGKGREDELDCFPSLPPFGPSCLRAHLPFSVPFLQTSVPSHVALHPLPSSSLWDSRSRSSSFHLRTPYSLPSQVLPRPFRYHDLLPSSFSSRGRSHESSSLGRYATQPSFSLSISSTPTGRIVQHLLVRSLPISRTTTLLSGFLQPLLLQRSLFQRRRIEHCCSSHASYARRSRRVAQSERQLPLYAHRQRRRSIVFLSARIHTSEVDGRKHLETRESTRKSANLDERRGWSVWSWREGQGRFDGDGRESEVRG